MIVIISEMVISHDIFSFLFIIVLKQWMEFSGK